MASSRHTSAPTSRRTGLGAGALLRALREAVRVPVEAVRLPPADFFCVAAMLMYQSFRGVGESEL